MATGMMSTADLESKIRQAAVKNRELLSTLSSTNHAVPDLAQQRRLIADLEHQLAASDKHVKELDTRRRKELKDHEKYRDSVMRRFVHKAVGKRDKFDEKAAREEREYFDVLQEEHREKEINKNLRTQLDEATRARQPLEEAARTRRRSGSWTEASRAMRAYQDTRSKAEAEQHAIKLLMDAMKRMGDALRNIDDALSHSRMDMFGGGTMSDMMERSALQRAESATQEAKMLVMQAQRMTPYIGDLPPVNINHGNLMGDVLFDNIFTDMAFHDEIKKSRMSVERCTQALSRFLHETRDRHERLMRDGRERERRLDETREALQKERERLFEIIAGNAAEGKGSYGGIATASGSMSKPWDN
uniref:Uncharacterized protein n=1 Tax=Colletotrichum fructicola (strain Nara gc5) TaxID=1213859 RepID=L2FMJ6_COLFN